MGVIVTPSKKASKESIYTNKKLDNFSLVNIDKKLPELKKVIKDSGGIDDFENAYTDLIREYEKIIELERPDLILLNGTYYLPWCFFTAAKRTKIPIVLHYHGILTKEVAHWKEKPRILMERMEKTFDNDRLFYLFPSKLAKTEVEKEVFGHKISKSAIIPNPVSKHFFEVKKIGRAKNIGIVERWSEIKNPKFVKKLAIYNKKQGGQFRINVITNINAAKKTMGSRRGLIKLIKPMETGKLAHFYGTMGVVLSPSYFETYGNVAQEAIASGTPALVSENMGIAETFRELGLSDWVISFSPVNSVYRKIVKVSGMVVPESVRDQLRQTVSSEKVSARIMKILTKV